MGCVYHANYLKYFERARTDWLMHHGFDHNLFLNQGLPVFMVKRLEIDYVKAAYLGDVLEVHTQPLSLHRTYVMLDQSLHKNNQLLTKVKIQLVCVDKTFKVSRIPLDLQNFFCTHLNET